VSAAETLDRVVARLGDAGYEALGARVQVASIPYEFDAVLLGPPNTLDLIIVVNTVTESPARLCQKVDGLGRALDIARSRRAVTAILVGPTPDGSVLASIRSICRYLLVAEDESPFGETLDDRLAVLLPLQLTTDEDDVADPIQELFRRLPPLPEGDERLALIAAAPRGESAVAAELKRYVERPLLEDDH
jgi:hypothetical protein